MDGERASTRVVESSESSRADEREGVRKRVGGGVCVALGGAEARVCRMASRRREGQQAAGQQAASGGVGASEGGVSQDCSSRPQRSECGREPEGASKGRSR